jgi:hypothetical protein
MDLTSLRKEAEAIPNAKERSDALRQIEELENGVRIAETGHALIKESFAPPRQSRSKLVLITIAFGFLAYFFQQGFVAILDAGGYTERHSGQFITAASAPLSYWLGLGFFASSFVFLAVVTLGCALALFTYPVPLLHWLRGRRRNDVAPEP